MSQTAEKDGTLVFLESPSRDPYFNLALEEYIFERLEMKFSGSSQYAKRGRLMHHGCIMLDSNLQDVTEALRVSKAKYESRAIKSVRSRITTINANTKNLSPWRGLNSFCLIIWEGRSRWNHSR